MSSSSRMWRSSTGEQIYPRQRKGSARARSDHLSHCRDYNSDSGQAVIRSRGLDLVQGMDRPLVHARTAACGILPAIDVLKQGLLEQLLGNLRLVM